MCWKELRGVLRSLRKNLGFTGLSVGLLALGMGASIAVFSIVNSVLLKPLPFPDAERVFTVWDAPPAQMNLGFDETPLHPREFQFIAGNNRAFEYVASFKSDQFNLNGASDVERVDGIRASRDFFKVLGIQPLSGRTFLAEEDHPGSEYEVVISYSLWRRRFASDLALVGKTVRLNSEPYTVIGVMPEGFAFPRGAEMPKSFQFPKQAELWVPLALPSAPRGPSDLALIARSRTGISQEQAGADLQQVNRGLVEQDPRFKGWANFKLIPLRTQVEGDARPRLLMVAGAVLFVLLITCGNVSNLLLTRSLGRIKDFAVRAALGARRVDLIRQLLTESLLLALLGTSVGLLLSAVIVNVVRKLFSPYIPRLSDAHLDLSVIGFAVGLAFFAGILFGVFPAIQLSGSNLIEYLKSREQKYSGQSVKNFRSVLVAGQIALSLVLVIGAGLLVRSFVDLLKADPGFQSSHLMTMEVTLPASKYSSSDAIAAVYRRILDRLPGIPGVESAAVVKPLPLGGTQEETVFTINNRPPVRPENLPTASYTIVSPDYFKAANVPLLRGRAFTEADDATSPLAVIISQAMAREFWPGEDPVGHLMSLPDPRYQNMTIVGVAGDVKKFALSDLPGPEMYVPYKQKPYPSILTMSFVLRTSLDSAGLANELQQAVKSVDPELPVANVAPMAELVSRSMSAQRLSASVLGAFSAVALILAVVGIYGVISYMVNDRNHEIGVRIALGAQKGDVLRLVFSQAARLVAAGLALGLVAALSLTRMLTSFVFGIKAIDPLTFTVAPVALLMAASLAIYIPARRASGIDPLDTLRNE
jgi:putative ABC transport system permease protein